MNEIENKLNLYKAQIGILPVSESDKFWYGFYFDLMDGLGNLYSDAPLAKEFIQLGTLNKIEGRPYNAGLQMFGVFLGMAHNILKNGQGKGY